MASILFYNDPVGRLHQEALQREKEARFKPQPRSLYDYRLVEWQARDRLINKLAGEGLRVSLTTNNCPFDLWVEGVKVELKASRWGKSSGGRYQAAIRNHKADLVIFDCINGTDHWHIIPMIAVAPRKHLAVWQYDPAESRGQWVQFLEQWDYLHQAIETANHIWQPPLL